MDINSDEPKGMLLQSVELSFEKYKYIKTILRLSKLNAYNMHYECELMLDCDAYAGPGLEIKKNYIDLDNPITPDLSDHYGFEVSNIQIRLQNELTFTINFTNNESIDVQMSNIHNGYYPTTATVYECDVNSRMLIYSTSL